MASSLAHARVGVLATDRLLRHQDQVVPFQRPRLRAEPFHVLVDQLCVGAFREFPGHIKYLRGRQSPSTLGDQVNRENRGGLNRLRRYHASCAELVFCLQVVRLAEGVACGHPLCLNTHVGILATLDRAHELVRLVRIQT